MSKTQLKRLSPTHTAIANWLIANPGKGQMRRCAAVFDVSQAWLSQILHSDAFQGMLQAKQRDAFEHLMTPLADKINGVAHRAVERLGEVLDQTTDERLVHDIAKTSTGLAGFGPSFQAAGNVTVNNQTNITVNADALREARERRSQHYGGNTIEGASTSEQPALEAKATELPTNKEFEVGEPRDVRSGYANSEAEVQGTEEEGGGV